EKKGKSVGDLRERASELRQSASDVRDMRNDKDTEYRYAKASSKDNKAGTGKPATGQTGMNASGDQIVTMFVEGNISNRLHETRHGGQVARGEYGFSSKGNPTSGYGVTSEISAYRAQYSYNGELNYIDATIAFNQQLITQKIMPPTSTVTSISVITPKFIRYSIGEVSVRTFSDVSLWRLTPLYESLP
ncbi:MAG: hypothetical protein LBN29_05360, partial [Mediterranea sp.]|nr:hypothetical protein [Mediterranea sp.]